MLCFVTVTPMLNVSAWINPIYTFFPDSSTCSTTGSLRLYNTVTGVEGEGAVQICYNDTWYGVCDYSWDCADANVACRQLGYTHGAG